VSTHTDHALVPVPDSGRVFGLVMRPGLADCAPSGRMRLDAIARWLQDVAWADVEDAGVGGDAFWILRRTRIRVNRFPRINEPHMVRTFCSGTGRLVAERRTVISPFDDPQRPDVETSALWVHLDPNTRRPSNLSPEELAILSSAGYGERRVSHRLRHLRPEAGEATHLFDWRFRRVDTDVADHVNNAAYWELLEEELLAGPAPLETVDAEIEFRDGAQPGMASYLRDAADGRFIVNAAGDLLATIALEPVVAPAGRGPAGPGPPVTSI
jgi:acyl-ACP thioesterase